MFGRTFSYVTDSYSCSTCWFITGNNHLGGQDFNVQLQNYLLNDIYNEFQHRLTDPNDMQQLRSAVETAKIRLTTESNTLLELPLTSIHKVYKKNISRDLFEDINKELFEKVLEPVKVILNYTELSRAEVDEIVMVGGSTRIPKVRQLIRDYFNKSLNTGIDADLAVVSGVSIQAGIIGGMWPLTVSAVEVQNSVQKIVLQ